MKDLYILLIVLLTIGVSNAQSTYSASITWSPFDSSGATLENDVYTFPSTAQAWAGFANTNAVIYPLNFTASADSDATIMFKVENAPHPDVNPNAELGTVTVIGGDPAATYEVVYNPDPADTHPYRSLLMYVQTQDVAVTMTNFIIYSDDVLSVAKANDFELSLYPNPAKDIVRISAVESIEVVRIYELSGRLVKQASPCKAAFSVDVSGLSKGVYLLKLSAGDKEAITKMIK
jgi:hypothetical protein